MLFWSLFPGLLRNIGAIQKVTPSNNIANVSVLNCVGIQYGILNIHGSVSIRYRSHFHVISNISITQIVVLPVC